ncbi:MULTISPECIES: hypothetical protein [unclassified Paenibacillus]|uniref:hypothetical protein n=1 Tax=unclassified Paenibacillus TaxID=185978 RepID=UPI003636D300
MLDAIQNATIVDGAIIAPDGVDVSHRLKVEPRKTLSQQKFVRNRSIMGRFSEENGNYVTAFFESCVTMAERFPSLTQSDLGRLMFIGTYTGYDDGSLRHDNGITINRASLMKLVGISREQFSKFFSRLLADDVIREDDGVILVNPTVFTRGEVSSGLTEMQHIRIYRKTVRELYEEFGKGRDVKQLAIVFTVIPFLHFNTNIICYNPQEYYYDQLRPMTVDKLAALLDYAEWRKLKLAMNSVKLGGQPVFAFVEDVNDSRKRRIIVNPRVVFAGNAEGLEQLRALCVLFN